MSLPRRALAGLLTVTSIAILVGASASPPSAPTSLASRDSVTLRVTYKWWGGELEQCYGMNWGWDSLTWRIAPGMSVGSAYLSAQFTLGPIIAPDSAWLVYPTYRLRLSGQPSDRSQTFASDSVIVTRQPVAFRTFNVKDAEGWFKVKLVTPWPEPPPKRIKTGTLRGRVVDDSTGCAVYFCQVVVEGTSCSAHSDTLGEFVLTNVPVGNREIDACAAGYVSGHAAVQVSSTSVLFRLRRGSGLELTRPCR